MNAELMEFMVGKKTPGQQDKKNEHDTSFQTPTSAASPPFKSRSSQRKSRTSTISSSFYKVLVHSWLDADDTAEEFLRSIVNLQERISQELIVADRLKYQRPQVSWKSFGFRSSSEEEGLTLSDINMTLDRDLVQHEAMLAQLRHYVSNMSKAQESMGRRLSEWYDEEDGTTTAVEHAQTLYAACAKELYRKQCMVQSMCDVAAAEIGNHQVSTAKACLSKWKRSSKESHLVTMLDEIKVLQKRYDD